MVDLLDRNFSLALSASLRGAAGPVLREVVDYGLRAFERCSASAEGHDTPLGVLFPFLHALEMLDGVEILLDSAADVPATMPLRSAFEALLSMEWVAKEDSERRGAAYVVADVHRRVACIERYDPTTQRGKELRARLASDPIGKTLNWPPLKDASEDRNGLLSVIEQPHLRAAAAEYQRTRALLKRRPEFYSLWDGPRNLEQLAQRVGRSAFYEILYRQWSGTAHADDLPRQLGQVGEAPAVARLRTCEALGSAYAHAINIGLEAIRTALEKYRPDELGSYWQWYRDKISAVYCRL